MSLPNLRLHGDAVVTSLSTASLVVGDGIDPTAHHGWRPGPPRLFIPYCIVYPMPGTFDGTLQAPDDDGELVFQVTCVGETRAACQLIEDKVNTAILTAGNVTVSGRSIIQIRVEIGGGVRRDDTVQPAVFITTPRYRVSSVPA